MELRIRTYDETRSERVTIAVSPGKRVEIELADSSPSAEDGLLSNDRVKLDIARRERAELAQTLQESRDLVVFKDRVIDETEAEAERLRAKVIELNRKVEDYNTDRTTERNRADRINQERLDLVAELKTARRAIREMGDKNQRELAESRRFHPDTIGLIDKAVDVLFSEPVGRALFPAYETVGPRNLKEAVQAAREALAPFVHRDRTSQA